MLKCMIRTAGLTFLMITATACGGEPPDLMVGDTAIYVEPGACIWPGLVEDLELMQASGVAPAETFNVDVYILEENTNLNWDPDSKWQVMARFFGPRGPIEMIAPYSRILAHELTHHWMWIDDLGKSTDNKQHKGEFTVRDRALSVGMPPLDYGLNPCTGKALRALTTTKRLVHDHPHE